MRFSVLIFTMLAANACAQAQSTINLRSTAIIDPSAPVTLGAIATVEGEDASKLRDVVLIEASARTNERTRIDPDSLSATLKNAGFKLGRITFSGSTCVIDPYAPETAQNKGKSTTKSSCSLASEVRTCDVRGAVCAKLAELYGLSPEAVRLSFRSSDDSLLNTSVEGLQVTVQPAAGGKSVPVQVRVFQGDHIVVSGTIRVGVEVLRPVLVSVTTIERSESISAGNTITDTRWLTPDIKPASSEDAFGTVAQTRIEPGAIVEARAIKAPNVVTKGEIVRIDCLSGGIALQSQARALEHGKQGQVIQFQSLNSKKIFRARVSGEGSAVADISNR